ncbi:MAG: class I SAM-dependent methyltransferase [Actinomycetia bacterium]|nr:class I SAM-dependent methyltransferase [Actinomycetes bacterium]
MSDDSGWQVAQAAPRHYQNQVSRFMEPFATALVDACVSNGDIVLDVACGTGIATRMAADKAGTAGRIVGTDINGAMVDLAAEVSYRGNIEWRQASALDLPYANGIFDSVICQQGLQFFPSPEVGLAEMARVSRSGATLGATVWSDLEDSPYLDAMHHMLGAYCDVDQQEMAWSSDSEQVVGWFLDAGLNEPMIDSLVLTVSLPPLEDFVPAHMKATPWADRFDSLSQTESANAVRFMSERLSDWITPAGADVPFSSYLASIVT